MAKETLKRGIFITFEGPEGCGKSTHARRLCGYLKRRGYDCICTREPGGTETGERIRDILLHSKDIHISNMAETLLFEASRAQILEEVIRPSLAAKKIVICDRYSDSTVCYQGYGGKVPMMSVMEIDRMATGGLKPDITILLDIDTMTGLRRAKKKGMDRMERKAFAYHRRVRAGYLALARLKPRRIRVVKVADAIGCTQDAVRNEVERVIQRYTRAR